MQQEVSSSSKGFRFIHAAKLSLAFLETQINSLNQFVWFCCFIGISRSFNQPQIQRYRPNHKPGTMNGYDASADIVRKRKFDEDGGGKIKKMKTEE